MKFSVAMATIIESLRKISLLLIITGIANLCDVPARPIITTTERVDQQVNNAVNKERQSWQNRVSENESKIKTLQSNLDKAVAEAKRLSSEKVSYEKKAKDDLDMVTKEKTNAVNELTKAKKEFENTRKNLNASILNLQKEVQTKENEKESLSKKVAATEKARITSENKLKKTMNDAKKRYNMRIKKMNTQISQKTAQLKEKTVQLSTLNSEYKLQSENMGLSEASAFCKIEILKGEVKKLKTELKILISSAKAIETEREQYIENVENKFMLERQDFIMKIKANQNMELQNLLKIAQLNDLIHNLVLKNSKLEEAGRTLELKLIAKIDMLKKQQALFAKKYELVVKAYTDAETKNLLAIDSLKQELNEAKSKNHALMQVAEQMNKEKVAEDFADSRLEAKTLLKVDDLTSELNKAVRKNKFLIDHIQNIRKQVDRIKQSGSEAEQKYHNKVKTLTNELQKATSKFKQLLEKHNSRGNWKQEKLEQFRNNASIFYKIPNASNNISPKMIPQQNTDAQVPQEGAWRNELVGVNLRNAKQQGIPYNAMPGYISNENFIGNTHAQGYRQEMEIGRNTQYPETTPAYTADRNPHAVTQNSKHLLFQPSSHELFQDKTSALAANLDTTHKTQNDDELVDFAVDTTLKSIQKMNNHDVEKINAAMNLLGAGDEVPKKLNAILDVIKEKFSPEIYKKAIQKITNMYSQREDFLDESMKHLYGKNGDKLLNWPTSH